MNKIAVLGANPAWQKTLVFKEFSYAKVNRAVSIDQFASGKGINFCRACFIQNTAIPVLLQFAGGENGRKLLAALDELGIEHATSITSSETRVCTTLLNLADHSTTECIEPSYAATEEEISKLIELAQQVIPQCRAVAVCGTLPGETDCKVYKQIADIAAENGVPVLLDACKNVDGILNSNCKIHLKINKEELFLLSGKSEVCAAMKQLFAQYSSLQTVAVTDGPEQAFASDGKEIAAYTLPVLDLIVSTLGCGDTASAVYCSNLISDIGYALAFKMALAAASANCLSALCGNYNLADAEKIENMIICSVQQL